MMGYRRFAPKLYYQLSLDRLVPQDHLPRRIAEVIDFSFVYSLARPYYSHTGQPSVPACRVVGDIPPRSEIMDGASRCGLQRLRRWLSAGPDREGRGESEATSRLAIRLAFGFY